MSARHGSPPCQGQIRVAALSLPAGFIPRAPFRRESGAMASFTERQAGSFSFTQYTYRANEKAATPSGEEL